ncbi:MAG: type II secretion system protein [Chthonomonadales bacterium]|nr:type II secretion system protein [Chthonomonadales bacterium]
MSGRAASRQRGFTLIEMMVAAVLLMLGVVASMACVSTATRWSGVAHEYTIAGMLAQRQLARLAADPANLASGDQQGEFGDEYPNYAWDVTAEQTDLPDLVRVTMTVSWSSGPIRRSAVFITYESTAEQAAGAEAGAGAAPR